MAPTFSKEGYEILKKDIFHMQKELINIEKYAKDGISASKDIIEIVKSGKTKPKKENRCIKIVKKVGRFVVIVTKKDITNNLNIRNRNHFILL